MQDSVGKAHKTTEGLEGLQQTGNEQDMKTLINVISVSEIWLFYFYFIQMHVITTFLITAVIAQ